MTPVPAIGGVLPAEPASAASAGSVWEAWSGAWLHAAAYVNARSALTAVLADRRAPRAWLPAYICTSLADGVRASGAELRFYAVGPRLEPDLEALARDVRSGDAVVIVDYFGRAEPELWRDVALRRPDVIFIEDRAQALDTAAPPLGEAVIFSPRKLLGVADGGLAFARSPLPQPERAGDDSLWAPQDGRAADPEGLAPETWRPQFTAVEDGMAVAPAAATARTLAALRSAESAPIGEARRANWRHLAGALGDWALFPDLDPAFVPLAFPILAEDAAAAVAVLAAARIWAPRHWASLPSDPEAFREAHRLAHACVSLPLDQRYGAEAMARIIAVVRGRVAPYPR